MGYPDPGSFYHFHPVCLVIPGWVVLFHNAAIGIIFVCYTHPKVDSLAETFLWQPDGGPIAVLAPSSLTLPYDQSYLSRSLAQLIMDNPTATLRELHLKARRQTPLDNTGGLDVMRTFMLFGDPPLRLAGE